MPSPFPGMNPYLEQDRAWHDFHERYIPAIAESLGGQVDPAYVVKIDEHVYIHDLAEDTPRLVGRGDVTLAKPPTGSEAEAGVATLEAPAHVRLPALDMEGVSYIEVRDRDGWQLVTVIELLSPTNKRSGPNREQYLAKRAEIVASDVHLVELDLLRGGARLPMEELPVCDYYAMVSRSSDRPAAGIWPLRLRDQLPRIPVPLRAPDRDATLDLQAVLHRVYDAARYGSYIYRGSPQPPLDATDDTWARQVVASASLK